MSGMYSVLCKTRSASSPSAKATLDDNTLDEGEASKKRKY